MVNHKTGRTSRNIIRQTETDLNKQPTARDRQGQTKRTEEDRDIQTAKDIKNTCIYKPRRTERDRNKQTAERQK